MRIILSLFTTLALSLLVPAQEPSPKTSPTPLTLTCTQEPACGHFFSDGRLFKTMTSETVIVSVSLSDTGKYLRADVAVTNNGPTPVDILPATFNLKSLQKDSKDLKYVPPDKMIHSAQRRVAWGSALAAAGSGMQRNQSTTQSSTNGNVNVYGSDGTSANGTYNGTTTSTTSSPDYAAQERTRQQIAQRRADLAAESGALLATSFLATTLTTGQVKAGRVYFERNRHHEQTLLTMKIGTETYEFPLTFTK